MTPRMNMPVIGRTDQSGCSGCGSWRRVSSFKPQLVAVLLVAIAVWMTMSLLVSRNDLAPLVPIITGGAAVAFGVTALSSKVVHRRGNDYRISTLFYSEVATVDDVCMAVTKPGPLWTRLRIHLRRPARFGWTITFVPTDEALAAFRDYDRLPNAKS